MNTTAELIGREHFGRQEIKALLPHREPMLLLDGAWRMPGAAFGTGELYIDPAWPWFAGHYPGAPIMPGVLMTEHMAQSACFFLLLEQPQAGTPLLARIELATFSAAAYPGDRLETEVSLERQVGGLTQLRTRTRRNGKTIAKASLLVGFANVDQDTNNEL